MKRWLVLLLAVGLVATCGCTTQPKEVFFDSTRAFAEGDIDRGMAHFSSKLKQRSSRNDLEYYYSIDDNRAGMKFLLEAATFQMVEEDDERALARVIWSHGRVEPVYFVKESGKWRLDAPPARTP